MIPSSFSFTIGGCMGMEPHWEQIKERRTRSGEQKGRETRASSALSFMVPRAKLLASGCHRGRGVKPLGTGFGGCLGGAVVFIWQHLCKSYVQLASSGGACSLSLGLAECGMEDWLVIGFCRG